MGECSLIYKTMFYVVFFASAKLSPFGDFLHVRKQPRNYMTFAFCKQKGFDLKYFSLLFVFISFHL